MIKACLPMFTIEGKYISSIFSALTEKQHMSRSNMTITRLSHVGKYISSIFSAVTEKQHMLRSKVCHFGFFILVNSMQFEYVVSRSKVFSFFLELWIYWQIGKWTFFSCSQINFKHIEKWAFFSCSQMSFSFVAKSTFSFCSQKIIRHLLTKRKMNFFLL